MKQCPSIGMGKNNMWANQGILFHMGRVQKKGPCFEIMITGEGYMLNVS
jgi:hypothetical protein